jgi:CelD/BcsL family acetyltransferase involved in cellulose biosynthesis
MGLGRAFRLIGEQARSALNMEYGTVPAMESLVSLEQTNGAAAQAAPLGAEVRVLRSLTELEELRPVWTEWKGHPHSDIDFFKMLLESREEILRPHVIVVFRGGRPDAMLVGRLERAPVKFEIGYLPFLQLQALRLMFQYEALRGNPSEETCAAIIRAILEALKSGEADLATLSYPATDSQLSKKARSLPGFLSRDSAAIPQAHHRLLLSGTMEELFRGYSNSHRQAVRSHGRKLEKKLGGRMKFRCFREVADLEEGIATVEQVARKTYHRGLGVGFDDSPRSRQVLQFYARRGQLRMYVLSDGDRPITFWVGVVHDNWFHSEHTGFDPEYRDCSPGTYLFVKMIEEFYAEGLEGVDFGLGDAVYKERFGNHLFEEAVVEIYAPRAKGLAIKSCRSLETAVASTVKKVFSRTDFILKLKKSWRERLARKSRAQQ